MLSLNILLLLLQDFEFSLGLAELLVELLGQVLLLSGFVLNTVNLRVDLHNLVTLLVDKLSDGLQGFVTLLHTEQGLLPIFEQGLLGHNDSLDFDGGLLKSVTGGGRFLFLRDKLSLVQGLLLIETLDFFVHGVDKKILLLLDLFEVANVLLSTVGGPSCQCKL